MKMIKKLLKDHKGLSLVELIVTVAIMALVSAGVATAVVSATRNYSRGNSEVDLQQEVQVITNILNNIVIDSIDASNPEGSTSKLNVTSRNGDFYVIECDGTNLSYTKTSADGASSGTEVLSTYVTTFSANAGDYDTDRTVVFNLGFTTTQNQREMKTSFTATSRNAETKDTAIQKLYSATIVAETLAVVEPNQTITIPFDVLVSGDAETSISYVSSAISSDSVLSVDTDFTQEDKKITFTAGPNEAHETITVSLKVEGMKDGAEVYNAPPVDITIKVRRIKMADPENGYKPFDIEGNPDDPQNDTVAGAVHRISVARLDVQNPERYFAVSTDTDYVEPYKVKYTYSTVKYTGGVTLRNETTGETGAELIADRDDIITVTLGSTMSRGDKIIVTAVAAHSGFEDGSADNKSTHTYAYNFDEYIIQVSLFAAGSGYKRGVDEGEPAHGSIGSKYDKVYDYVTNGYLDILTEIYAGNPEVLAAINAITSKDNFASQISDKCGYEAFYSIGAPSNPGDPYGNHYMNETDENGRTWKFSQYKTMSDDDSTGAFHFDKIGDADSDTPVSGKGGAMRLEPDKDYNLEFCAVLYTKEEVSLFNGLVKIPAGTILWPKYDKLMELGFGGGVGGANFSFYRTTVGGTSYDICALMTDTDGDKIIDDGEKLSFMRQYDIKRGQIQFKANTELGITEGSPNAGSESDPLILGTGLSMPERNIQYDQMEWTGIALNAYQNRINAVLEVNRKNGDGWQRLSNNVNTTYQSDEGGFKVVNTNTGYKFSEYQGNSLDLNCEFRLVCDIVMNKYFIKDSDGVFNDTYYPDTNGGNKYTYFYPEGTGCVYFTRYDINTVPKLVLNYNYGGYTRIIPILDSNQQIYIEKPTRENFQFLGWYTRRIGGTKITDGNQSYHQSNIAKYKTLYAHWRQTSGEMTITLNPNGGTVNPTSIKFDVTKTIAGLPTPTHSDSKYTFDGWYTSPYATKKINNGSNYNDLDGADELYAIWVEAGKKYIYLDPGEGSLDVIRVEVTGNRIPALPSPSRDGYKFQGWSSDANNFNEVRQGNNYNNIRILYAFYQDAITLDGNGGTVNGDTLVAYTNGQVPNLPGATRDGYIFLGWTTSRNGSKYVNSGEWDTSYAGTTLYASWGRRENSNTASTATQVGSAADHLYKFSVTASGGIAITSITIYIPNGSADEAWRSGCNGAVSGHYYTLTPYNGNLIDANATKEFTLKINGGLPIIITNVTYAR